MNDDEKRDQTDMAWAQTLYSSMAQLRWRLAAEQNWRCCFNGCVMDPAAPRNSAAEPTLEHIVPRIDGGTDHIDNLVVACRACNDFRGNEIFPIHRRTFKEDPSEHRYSTGAKTPTAKAPRRWPGFAVSGADTAAARSGWG